MTEMIEAKPTFLDSNILVYLMDKDLVKREIVLAFVSKKYIISTQVVAENVNACMRSLKLSKEKSYNHGIELLEKFNVVLLNPSTFHSAFKISNKYQLSWWDSLIVSSALENNCEILYSEDMQDGLVIESKLTIINPFK
jgi:predicted nucleic acid-binding protein